MRELRGEMERLRNEREEWEAEAGRERERRETMEDELRNAEWRQQEEHREMEEARSQLEREAERADNLQEVLSEFQAGKSPHRCGLSSRLAEPEHWKATSTCYLGTRLTNVLAKDSELRQATSELESQLRLAATSLSEYKLRAANAETKLGELSNTATKSVGLEKEVKDRNQLIAKLRHDGELSNTPYDEAHH